MAAEIAPISKRNRTRSPSYPYLDLQGALEKAAVLWHAEGRHAASISVVMQHWGYKEESSTGYSCVAALKKFGLVDHEGMGETRQMKLSGLALRILLDDDPQSDQRRMALREAALNPGIHEELWERYGFDLPSDQSLKRFLVLERSFNEASVDELLAEYKATMAYAGLAARVGGAAPGALAEAATGGAGAVPRLPAASPAPAVTPVTVQLAPAVASGSPVPSAEPMAVARERRNERALPPRAVGPPPASDAPRAAIPTPPQRDLFGERDAAAYLDDERFAAEAAPVKQPPASPAPPAADPAGFWSLPRRELPVPLDNGLVASVPYPMTEEDFMLLIDTLQLWKKRLVQPSPR